MLSQSMRNIDVVLPHTRMQIIQYLNQTGAHKILNQTLIRDRAIITVAAAAFQISPEMVC